MLLLIDQIRREMPMAKGFQIKNEDYNRSTSDVRKRGGNIDQYQLMQLGKPALNYIMGSDDLLEQKFFPSSLGIQKLIHDNLDSFLYLACLSGQCLMLELIDEKYCNSNRDNCYKFQNYIGVDYNYYGVRILLVNKGQTSMNNKFNICIKVPKYKPFKLVQIYTNIANKIQQNQNYDDYNGEKCVEFHGIITGEEIMMTLLFIKFEPEIDVNPIKVIKEKDQRNNDFSLELRGIPSKKSIYEYNFEVEFYSLPDTYSHFQSQILLQVLILLTALALCFYDKGFYVKAKLLSLVSLPITFRDIFRGKNELQSRNQFKRKKKN